MTASQVGAVPARLLHTPLHSTQDQPHPRATVRRIRGRWWVTLWADRDEVANVDDKHIAWLHLRDAMDWAAQRVHYERLAAGQAVINHRRPTP